MRRKSQQTDPGQLWHIMQKLKKKHGNITELWDPDPQSKTGQTYLAGPDFFAGH